jgi:hypothetical protein
LAGALAELSVHIARSGLLLAAAGAFAVLALTARGPLGIARLCGPKVHAALDIVVALAIAAAPLFPALRPDLNGILVVEVAAVGWLRLATLTSYTRPGHRSGARAGVRDVGPSRSAVPGPPSAGSASVAAPKAGAVVARGLGILAGRSARRLPDTDERLRAGARQAGRHAARLRARRKPPS